MRGHLSGKWRGTTTKLTDGQAILAIQRWPVRLTKQEKLLCHATDQAKRPKERQIGRSESHLQRFPRTNPSESET